MRGERLHVAPDQLQVLGREGVGELQRLWRTGRLRDDEARLLVSELVLELRRQRVGNTLCACDANDEAPGPMLGLREHVQRGHAHGALVGVCAGYHEQVARPGEAVDAHDRRQQVLGLLHVQVAGSHHHVDARDRLRSIRERGDRLGAAHAVHALHATQPAGPENGAVDLPVGARGGTHGHVEHAGGARGHNAHDDRARIRRPSARHIHRRGAERNLAQAHALALRQRHRHVLAGARLGHLGDVGDRHLQASDQLERQSLQGVIELLRRDGELARLAGAGVKTARVPKHGLIAPCAHRLDDLAHLLFDRLRSGDQRAQVLGERRRAPEAARLLAAQAIERHLMRRQRPTGVAAGRAAGRWAQP